MENNQVFTYQYSAMQNKEIESIRSKYLPKEESKIDILRRMDNRVQTAGMLQGLIIGIVGCLIFGVGMCFGLDVFAGADWLTVFFCVIGMLLMIPARPIYKFIEQDEKRACARDITSFGRNYE